MNRCIKEPLKKKGDSKMTKVEQAKQRMKEEYAKKVDEYFEQYEELQKSGKINIDEIEGLLGKGIVAAKEVLTTTSEQLLKTELGSNEDGGKKKRVRPVEKP
jgi:thioredoxin-like negative regulator of GroEL